MLEATAAQNEPFASRPVVCSEHRSQITPSLMTDLVENKTPEDWEDHDEHDQEDRVKSGFCFCGHKPTSLLLHRRQWRSCGHLLADGLGGSGRHLSRGPEALARH